MTLRWELKEHWYEKDIDLYSSTSTEQAKHVWNSYINSQTIDKGLENNIFKISTPSDLAYFAKQVNYGEKDYLNCTVKLTNDIDMGGKLFTPIGGNYVLGNDGKLITNNIFKGTFDGSGFTISNLTVIGNNNVGLNVFNE